MKLEEVFPDRATFEKKKQMLEAHSKVVRTQVDLVGFDDHIGCAALGLEVSLEPCQFVCYPHGEFFRQEVLLGVPISPLEDGERGESSVLGYAAASRSPGVLDGDKNIQDIYCEVTFRPDFGFMGVDIRTPDLSRPGWGIRALYSCATAEVTTLMYLGKATELYAHTRSILGDKFLPVIRNYAQATGFPEFNPNYVRDTDKATLLGLVGMVEAVSLGKQSTHSLDFERMIRREEAFPGEGVSNALLMYTAIFAAAIRAGYDFNRETHEEAFRVAKHIAAMQQRSA